MSLRYILIFIPTIICYYLLPIHSPVTPFPPVPSISINYEKLRKQDDSSSDSMTVFIITVRNELLYF